MLWTVFLSAIWFLSPAGFANMTPVFAARLFPKFTYPLDGFHTFRGQRLFGDHKTIRGIVSGMIVSECIFIIQRMLYTLLPSIQTISWYDYSTAPIFLGLIMGAGAVMGDAMKSFFKRQFHIRPGRSWFPFDQTDWVTGLFIAISPWVTFDMLKTLAIIAFGMTLHLLSKIIGKKLSFNEEYI